MKIAVIGDYKSPEYKDFLKKVKMAFPEESITDLSAHTQGTILKIRKARQYDISESKRVIISPYFKKDIEALWDVTYAQEEGRDCYIDINGQFLPFPEFAHSL